MTAQSPPKLPTSNSVATEDGSNLGSSIRGGWRPILKQSKVLDWFCPKCKIQISSEVSGLRRCSYCGLPVSEFPESKYLEVDDKLKKDIDSIMGRFGEEIAHNKPPKSRKEKKRMLTEYKESDPSERPPMPIHKPLALGKPQDRGIYQSSSNYIPKDRQEAINRLCWRA